MSGASRPEANRAFNQRNQKAIQQNHEEVAAHGEVKPLILEHFDPRYRKAVAEGRMEDAQLIKEGWEQKVECWIPGLGAGVAAYKALEKGKIGQAAFYAAMAGAEGAMVGGFISKGCKAVGLAWKEAKQALKAGKVVTGAGAKVGGITIQQTFNKLGSLEGLGALKADEVLISNGFIFKGKTPGGYAKYYHPNGAKIQIRPNGQVYRYGGGKGLKYNMDGSISELHGQENILE